MRKDQKGFGVVEVLLVAVIIVLLGVVGWLFFSNQNDNKSNQETNQEGVSKSKSNEKTSTDNTASQYTLDNAVTDINKTLANEACGGAEVSKSDFIQVDDSDQFQYRGGKSIINNDLTYVYAQYGCGTSGNSAYLKRADAGWELIDQGQRIYPICSKIRGQGFPKSVVEECFISDDYADPIKI